MHNFEKVDLWHMGHTMLLAVIGNELMSRASPTHSRNIDIRSDIVYFNAEAERVILGVAELNVVGKWHMRCIKIV